MVIMFMRECMVSVFGMVRGMVALNRGTSKWMGHGGSPFFVFEEIPRYEIVA